MEKTNTQNRSLRGSIAGIVGIIVNILLAAGKIVVGSIFGLVSVVADGLNNLTDCASSIVSIVSFKLSSKPADKEHPYGHERIEYICSLSVAFLVLLVAFDTAREAIAKIITPENTVFSYWIIAVLGASIFAKLGLFLYYRAVAGKINSSILRASATDSLMDCVSTSVALVSFIISILSGFSVDGYAGVLVALFIAWSAIGILREIFSSLIGKAPDSEMLDDIRERIISYPGVLGVHDLSVYSYGPNKFFASVHIEVSSSVDVLVSHELVDEIERDFFENTNIVLTGHLDPIETDNDLVNELRMRVEQIVKGIDPAFSIHDFRMVTGERRTNVLFDIAIPFDATLSKEEIKGRVTAALLEIDARYCPIITVENAV
ncbi:MAG: cation transporter [Clostridia bacterium]|nr:cation transporter [Clostridia bacterium]